MLTVFSELAGVLIAATDVTRRSDIAALQQQQQLMSVNGVLCKLIVLNRVLDYRDHGE